MAQTEKTVFHVFIQNTDGLQSLYFFNWTERNKIALERIQKVIKEFWCNIEEIDIGNEMPLDMYENIKKNIDSFLYLINVEDKNNWIHIDIIEDEKIPFISDELYAKLGTKDAQEVENIWYNIADIINKSFK